MKKIPQYKRGSYNKPARLTKKTHISFTEDEWLKMVTLSTRYEKTYSDIMREAFKVYWTNEESKLTSGR